MLMNPAERFKTSDAQPLYIDLKKILLATDGSEAAISATKYAVAIAKLFKAKVRAVFVDSNNENLESVENIERPGVIGLKLARVYAAKNGVSCEELIVHGNTAKHIITAAEEYVPDLIILGNSNKLGLRRAMSSVIEIVMNGTDIPVLVVRNE